MREEGTHDAWFGAGQAEGWQAGEAAEALGKGGGEDESESHATGNDGTLLFLRERRDLTRMRAEMSHILKMQPEGGSWGRDTREDHGDCKVRSSTRHHRHRGRPQPAQAL